MPVTRIWLYAFLFLGLSSSVFAQYACPPGYYSIGGGQDAGGFHGCAPLEGGNQQEGAPVWESRWGAIALTNGAFGTVTGMPSEAQASSAAMKQCEANSRQGGCQIGITYHDQCVALAWGDGQTSMWRSPDKADAESHAMQNCSEKTSNCQIYYSDCSYPEQVQ